MNALFQLDPERHMINAAAAFYLPLPLKRRRVLTSETVYRPCFKFELEVV